RFCRPLPYHLGTAPRLVCSRPTLKVRPRCLAGRWSGRRDLNPRLRPWQGRTLPLSYSRSYGPNYTKPRQPPSTCRGFAETSQLTQGAINSGRQSTLPDGGIVPTALSEHSSHSAVPPDISCNLGFPIRTLRTRHARSSASVPMPKTPINKNGKL